MLAPTVLQELRLAAGERLQGRAHLSAASGLARAGPWLYVVADDEHHLGRFALPGAAAEQVHLHRLLPGELPAGKAARKRRKPDFEALALLPPEAVAAGAGTLFALGSGSGPGRQQGLLTALDAQCLPSGPPRAVDLAPWYRPLRDAFADLNIEGAFRCGTRFHLLQRGNQSDPRSASVEYAADHVFAWLHGHRRAPPPVQRIAPLDLGRVAGVSLTVTDGAAWPAGGWVFSAVAEDTADSWADGACAGSAIGWVDAEGTVQRLEPLAGAPKVEGIAVAGGRLLLATDADDAARPALLLAVPLA